MRRELLRLLALILIGGIIYLISIPHYIDNTVTIFKTQHNTLNKLRKHSYVEHFGDYDSVHLVHDVCVNASGIFYIANQHNQKLDNISTFNVHTDDRSSFHNIKLQKLNITNSSNVNITFKNKPIGYLLWVQISTNFFHFMFSFIGGYKAINLIKQSHPHLDINDIQLIYFGKTKINYIAPFETLYHKILTNLTRYPTLNIYYDLEQLYCYKTLIIGRASHWEIGPDDFTMLRREMNKQRKNQTLSTKNTDIVQYIKRAQNDIYLNVLLLNRKYPRRHIINNDTLHKSLINTFNSYIKVNKTKINIFKQNRKRAINFLSNATALELDLNILSIKFENVPNLIDQFKIIYNTDILISTHGAGLTWSVLMAEQSFIVELLPEISLGQCDPCIQKEDNKQWAWSMFAELTQWRYNHHICIINDPNTEIERQLSRDYIIHRYGQTVFKMDESKYADPVNKDQYYWKEIPYVISNTSLQRLTNILWNHKFGTLIKNNSRLWCRNYCGRYNLRQNWCLTKQKAKILYLCPPEEKQLCLNEKFVDIHISEI